MSSDEYLQLTESAPKGFNPAQYGAKSDSLEGFLFPATYELPANNNVKSLVDQQLQAFKDNLARVDLKAAAKKNLTAYDVLIIASMIDKEVQVPEGARARRVGHLQPPQPGDPARHRRHHPLRD